jgi:chromosome condensin MukBEF ATPase and DNA-binding subunit MukB
MREDELDYEQTSTSRPRGIRRKERTVYDRANPHGPTTPRSESGESRIKPQRNHRAIRARVCQRQSPSQNVGGIVRQLMAKAETQLAQVEKDLTQLEKTRIQLQTDREMVQNHYDQLQVLLEALQLADE